MTLMRFNHNKTDFKLEGAHAQIDCKACHTTLVFNEAPNQCATCHKDVHSALLVMIVPVAILLKLGSLIIFLNYMKKMDFL